MPLTESALAFGFLSTSTMTGMRASHVGVISMVFIPSLIFIHLSMTDIQVMSTPIAKKIKFF